MFDEYVCLFMMLIDHTVGNIIHMSFATNYISHAVCAQPRETCCC